MARQRSKAKKEEFVRVKRSDLQRILELLEKLAQP
jgi:hypothetical protein